MTNHPVTVDAIDVLACPRCAAPMAAAGQWVQCREAHRFPVVEGVAVLLREDVEHTIGIAERSLALARAWVEGARDDPLFVDTLGISDTERAGVRAAALQETSAVDPVVSFLVGATNGILYRDVIGKLETIPQPDLRLPPGRDRRLLDIGCNWGRWSLAAAASGWRPIGIDPSLGAVLAAKRLAAARGLRLEGIVGDARYLPLRDGSVDAAFSYSVLQHFSKPDARLALSQVARAVRDGGVVRIQMASAMGIRSLQHMLRRGLREPQGFEVRYWSPLELRRAFEAAFGSARIEVDCYFGLGVQPSDKALYSRLGRAVVSVSEVLRKTSRHLPPLALVADSLYLVSQNYRQTAETTTRKSAT